MSAARRTRRYRELAAWALLAAAIAVGVTWRAGSIRDAVVEDVDTSHEVTNRSLLVRVDAWAQARVAHAETMAALLAGDLAGRGDGRETRLDDRFVRATEALARRGMFTGGRVLDRDGGVLVSAGSAGAPSQGPAAEPDADAGDRPRRARVGASAGAAPDRAPDRVRAVTVPCGDAFCAEFHAPIRSGGTRLGTVVLVAAVDDSTFRPLNASRPGIRTARASVLAPLGHVDGDATAADTFAVVASLGASGSPEPAPRRALATLPHSVHRVLAAPPGAMVTDTGTGLHGVTVHYASGRVPELDWVVLRELDRAEVLGSARTLLLIEEPILVSLLLLVVVLVRGRRRAARVRREQELTRLRADFVASTSHELRTPLAQIRMFAELLQRGTLRRPGEAERALRIIEKEASRLTILVDNLLNYTRLRRRAESAELDTLAPTRVADDVRQVIEAFAPLAAERGASVAAEVPDDLYARVDSLALRQVLINYLENAVKYGPSGQVVVVGASADERSVRLWVDDQGAGVPPDEREAVWEAFRRGAGAEASGHGGSGIGLAVVRELALQYGGGVALEEAPDGGARFVAEFPRADGASANGETVNGSDDVRAGDRPTHPDAG